MHLKLKFVFSVVFILHVSAKPLAGTGTCHVEQSYNCGKEKCPCAYDTNAASTLIKFLNAIVERPFKTCYCDKVCKKFIEVQCKEGTCDKKANKCKCFPCWTGTDCSKYVNKHQPRFTLTFAEINLQNNHTVGHTRAIDADASQCRKNVKCPCADLIYTLLEGGDGTFSIDGKTGEIKLESAPFKDDYLLVIGVSNELEMVSSKTFIQINTRNYLGRKTLIPHFRARRSVSSGTLVLTIKPVLTTVFYFNIGESITFTISLAHNASVTAVPASNIKIRISSEFLQLGTAGITKKSGSFSSSDSMVGDKLELSFGSESFGSASKYDANVTTTVKNSIGPLSSLKLTAELNATSNIYIKATSDPIVHAVYPKVNLTHSPLGAARTYDKKNFSMLIEFPKLNYSLLAELTTNIQDFIFMEIQDVQVKNKGSNVHYNGTATPTYYSTNNDGKKDRVVIDFGYLRNNADTENTVEITFTVKILDHVLLANNTIHWIGVGLQAGLRVLWVEQQSFTIIKEEPSLELQITAANFTNITRLYVGDLLPVSYTIKHTNTSTRAAVDVTLSCVFANLVIPNSEITSNKVGKVNDTMVDVKINPLLSNPLPLGIILTGVFNLELPLNVTPFTATNVKCYLNYKNAQGISKDVFSTELTPAVLVGTPSIILTVNASNTQIKPGETRLFTMKILLTKLRSPIRIELVMPMISNKSIYHISSVDEAVIGSNVEGLNTSARPKLISSQNDAINNFAIYDLGIGVNTKQNLTNPTADTISIQFNVLLLDHNNVTNGSSQWVGAGLVGKPYMIWVGQISMTTIVPVDSRPWLYLKPSIIPIADSKQYPDYHYNLVMKHKSTSNQLAHDTKIRFFLPDYVEFVSMISGSDNRLTQKQFGGSRLFEIQYPINFPESFNITFQVRINPAYFPHDGKVFITTPIYLLYKNRLGQQFTLVKLLRKYVIVPERLTVPTVTGVPEHYDKGISWHVPANQNTYTIYICSNDKAKRLLSACYQSTDKGVTWTAMDSRVSSILGHNADGNVVGIGKNKRAYMTYDPSLNTWVSIPKSKITGTLNYTPLDGTHSSGNPVSPQLIGLDHWGISKDGVFMKISGSGSWIKKSIWL